MTDDQRRDDDALSEPARQAIAAACRDAPLTVALGRLDAEVDTLTRHRAAAATAPDAVEIESACAALLFRGRCAGRGGT